MGGPELEPSYFVFRMHVKSEATLPFFSNPYGLCSFSHLHERIFKRGLSNLNVDNV